jgi:hypothetical protein
VHEKKSGLPADASDDATALLRNDLRELSIFVPDLKIAGSTGLIKTDSAPLADLAIARYPHISRLKIQSSGNLSHGSFYFTHFTFSF